MTIGIKWAIIIETESTTISFMHAYLRNLFGWYNDWHNHPRHQQVHWFGVFVFLLITSLVALVQLIGLRSEKNQARAQTGSTVAITSITPNSAPEGGTVTITGTNLDQCEPVYAGANLDPRCNVIFYDVASFRSTATDGRSINSTTVTATVPGGLCPGVGNVRVGSLSNPSNTLAFTITSGTGTNCNIVPSNRFIYYIYPDRAPAGTPITIAGYNLDALVHFYSANGIETTTTGIITGLSNSIDIAGSPNGVPTYISATIPATLAPGSYVARVGPIASDLSNEFSITITPDTYIPAPASTDPPTITGISPTTVSQGGTIEIYGDNLPADVRLIDNISSQVIDITGWANNGKNIVTVGISFIVIPGQYTVSVSGPNGSATSPDMLTVTESTNPVNPQSTDIVVPQATSTFEELISSSLSYAVYALGIAVFVMILYAGFLWMTSAANPGNIALAKRYITNAIIGAVLLLSSYIILYTINPDLVGGSLNLPGITPQPRSNP